MHSILAARTDFSLGESILTVEKLVEEAKAKGAEAVAVTDTMSITGMVDFTNRCGKAGIKPIIGTRLRISDDPAWRPAKGEKKKNMPRETFVTVYAMTEVGMKAIYRLLTLGNSEDRFYYTAKISLEDLVDELKATRDDLAIVFGDTHSMLAHPDADRMIGEIVAAAGPTHCYAALTPINQPYWGRMNELAIDAVTKHNIQPLVVRPAFYETGAADAHEIMGAVANGNKLSDGYHKSPFDRTMHLMGVGELVGEVKKAAEHMVKRGVTGAGPMFKRGLAMTDNLVNSISYTWSKQPVSLPVMAADEFEAVKQACNDGWKTRFAAPVFGHQPTPQELADVYLPRLKYELSVLKNLNFSGYFLLTQDVVNFAKTSGILVGPGRGSVGGSLVAYLMGITDCDPIRFNLLFERFINPDRIDLPDADLDFMATRRHEVFEYLTNKYGAAHVAGVSNYGRLGASSSIRDVGRTFGLSENDYRCSKFVPKVHGQPVELSKAAEAVPEIKDFADKYAALWTVMERLEGSMRSYGQHAAGVVVAAVPLTDRGVVERRKESSAVMCWDKRIVEDQGLVKLDILGLNTLDLTALTLDYIRERHGRRVNLLQIPLDDQLVLDRFSKADTNGIFQFDGGGMRRLLKELAVTGTVTFEDITACTALYRPGPMESGMMDSYYLRKQGNETIDYDHPLMEPILKTTYGVMVYQEQVMQVARAIAGYSAPDADKLRKIMGKKLPEEMRKERGKFVEGCVKTIQCDETWAGQLFDKIEGFAGYGFNRSHSIEYTLISYQSMWLKTYYPVEFYAASLTLMSQEKLPSVLRDARRDGIHVAFPDINNSSHRFEIVNDTRIVMPFIRIKGIGEGTVKAIAEARKAGPFKDKADFLARVEKRRCNVAHQEKLDLVGSFAAIESTQQPSNSPSRIRDQIELLPGLVDATVPVNHKMETGKEAIEDLGAVVKDYLVTHGATGDQDGSPVRPLFHKTNQFMLIQDCPGSQEDQSGKMGHSMNTACIVDALSKVGLDRDDMYWTALVKRPKKGKQVSPDEIATYAPYLMREIEILKPPVIVLMGTAVVRHFLPDFKGKASDAAGQVVYSKDLDANFVVGFNPGELYYAPEKQEQVDEIFSVVADILPY